MALSRARMARVLGQSSKMELPAIRDQGLRAWIHKRTYRPLEPPADEADGPRVGWTSRVSHDTGLTRPANGPTGGWERQPRQALGESEGLSFIR